MGYNTKQIEKHRAVIRNSVRECLNKLDSVVEPHERAVLEERVETTFILAGLGVNALEKFLPDPYISEVIDEIETYKKMWEGYKVTSELGRVSSSIGLTL